MLIINTPIGIMRAPEDMEISIKGTSDEQLINQINTDVHLDPFEFQEALNRGLYDRISRGNNRLEDHRNRTT